MIRVPGKVIAATTLVAVAPAAAVWGLRAGGVVTSFLACAGIGAVLSLAACQLAAWLWQRRPGSEDVLFGDLMVWGWIRRCAAQRRLEDAVSLLGLRRATKRSDAMSLSVERRVALLEQLAANLEARDPYTHGHSRRVARYAGLIAKRMGITGDELARIRTAAAVHDVGKLDTPTAILHKPGRLTDAEFEVVKQHPVTGASMVAILEDEQLAAIVRHHHERLDGTGYPDRLAASAIPLGARIISVADTFDAITSARPYRGAKPHRQALEILRAEAGTQLDREAVHAFCSVYLGRRPLGLWVAFTDLADRVVAWSLPDALSSTVRVAALAATTAAVGGGVAALPASAQHASREHRRAPAAQAHVTRTAVAGAAATRAVRAGSHATPSRELGHKRGQVRLRIAGHGEAVGSRTGRAAPVQGVAAASNPGSPGAGAGSGTDAPGNGSDLTATGSVAGGTLASGPGATVGVSAGSGVHVSVGGPSGSAVKLSTGSSAGTTSVGVSAGSGASAGVSVGSGAGEGSSGPSVELGLGGSGSSGSSGSNATGGAGSGQPGISAGLNVPGVTSVNLHLG